MQTKCSAGHTWNGCKCTQYGTVHDEQHVWKEEEVLVCEYQVASSYEAGNEYGPYHTEYCYRTAIVCARCGKEQ